MGPHGPPPWAPGPPEFFGELPPPARLAKKFWGGPGAPGGWGDSTERRPSGPNAGPPGAPQGQRRKNHKNHTTILKSFCQSIESRPYRFLTLAGAGRAGKRPTHG